MAPSSRSPLAPQSSSPSSGSGPTNPLSPVGPDFLQRDESEMPPGVFIIATPDFAPILLIRFMVGWVFIVEGLQKFVRPSERGAGLFESLGIPFPELMAQAAGGTEILCGLLVLGGVVVRVSVAPLLVILMAAVLRTKLPLLGSEGLVPFLHASSVETMLALGCAFLVWVGAGPLSMDRKWWTGALQDMREREAQEPPPEQVDQGQGSGTTG